MSSLLNVAVVVTALATGTNRVGEREGRFPVVNGWALSADSAMYTADNLWDFIDGAAELYLSYGFADLHVAEYGNASGTDVRVELYRHSSHANAFGMYSQERSPGYHFVDIGTQGYCEEGVLNFFCGVHYVKVSTHRSGAEGRDALERIGRAVAAHLGRCEALPPILQAFPTDGKILNSESFIAENFLGYAVLRSAYVVDYTAGVRLFIIERGSREEALQTMDSYRKGIGAEQQTSGNNVVEVSDPHNGQIRLIVSGRFLCGIVGTPDDQHAERYMREMVERISAIGH